MLAYSFQLALLSVKERWRLSLLAIITVAIGIGILMTIKAEAYQGLKLPLGEASLHYYLVQINNFELNGRTPLPEALRNPGLTYRDAMQLTRAETPAQNSSMNWKSLSVTNSLDQDQQPLLASTVVTDAGFFQMFKPPMLYGAPWSAQVDIQMEPVAIISKKLNDYFFAGNNSVGKQIQINNELLTIVGVMDNWKLSRRFYDRSFNNYSVGALPDDLYMPHPVAVAAELRRFVNMYCWPSERSRQFDFINNDIQGLMDSECTWINYWVQLDSDADVAAYKTYLSQYVAQQKELGRFPQEELNFLSNSRTLSEESSALDGRFALLQTLSTIFFVVCLMNTIGILLAKFMRKSKEVSLRRALGAKKKTVLMQYFLEVSIIGVAGGAIGLLFAWLGLQGRLQLYRWIGDYQVSYADIAHNFQLDWVMVLTAISIALIGTILVGLYPIWRICNISPAAQLKAQ